MVKSVKSDDSQPKWEVWISPTILLTNYCFSPSLSLSISMFSSISEAQHTFNRCVLPIQFAHSIPQPTSSRTVRARVAPQGRIKQVLYCHMDHGHKDLACKVTRPNREILVTYWKKAAGRVVQIRYKHPIESHRIPTYPIEVNATSKEVAVQIHQVWRTQEIAGVESRLEPRQFFQADSALKMGYLYNDII
jgi:hypothetical protein